MNAAGTPNPPPTTPSADAPPKVSVIIPTLDRRDALAHCLDALDAQTMRGFEVIVADDGSRDGTDAMLAERMVRAGAASSAPCIRTVRHESPRGANAARNAAMRIARGSLLAFLDSDCVPEPAWLAQLTGPFRDRAVAAVCGAVIDAPPVNVYEKTLQGTHRVAGTNADEPSATRRIVAGNLCLRRALLRDFAWDEDVAAVRGGETARRDTRVSGRCDEEGLNLQLRARGLRVLTAPRAIVQHHHHHDRRSFFRQALRGGRSAATLVWKYRLASRIDLLPFMLGYAALVVLLPWMIAISPSLLLVPLALLSAGVAALLENELVRKRKPIMDVVRTFPLVLASHHIRLVGYAGQSLRLRFGGAAAGARMTLERPLRD